ncbi:MAG: Gp37 family protein [Balneolales bacterium]
MGATLNAMAEAFLTKLEDTFPDLEVDHYPDDPAKYQLKHAKGAVLITMVDRKFKPGQATDGTGQVNEPVFQVTYVTRSLISKKQNPGAYDLLDTGRDALTKLEFDLSNASITREFFIDIKPGGVWMFAQNWTHTDYFD